MEFVVAKLECAKGTFDLEKAPQILNNNKNNNESMQTRLCARALPVKWESCWRRSSSCMVMGWWLCGIWSYAGRNMLSLSLSLFSVCVGQVRCRWIIDFFVFQLPKRNKQIHNLFECKEIELSLSHLQLTDRLVSRWQWHTCRTTKKLQEKVADHRP